MTLAQLFSGFGAPPPNATPGYGFDKNSNLIIILLVLVIILGFGNSTFKIGGFGFFNYPYPRCPVKNHHKHHHKKCRPVCRPICPPSPGFGNPLMLLVILVILGLALKPKRYC